MRIGIIVAAIACMVLPATAQPQQSNVDLERLANMYIRLCIAGGQQLQTKGTVSGGAKLSVPRVDITGQVQGTYEFDQRQVEGLVEGINNQMSQVAADQADKVRECLAPLRAALLAFRFPGQPSNPPPNPGHVPGWLVTFSANGAGGGNFSDYGSKTVVVPATGAIDIRRYFRPDMGGRNVLIKVTATTDQYVAEPGQWIYYVKLNGASGSYTDCTKFEVDADNVPIINAGRHILTGQTLDFGVSGTADQSIGTHHLAVTLECFILQREFPVVSLKLKPPSGSTWRSPGEREFTTVQYINPNIPPGER